MKLSFDTCLLACFANTPISELLCVLTLYMSLSFSAFQTWKRGIVYKWKANHTVSVLHCTEYNAKGMEEEE